MNLIINNLPATDARLKEIQSQQDEDPVCQKLKTYCQEGWPEKSSLKGPFKPYLPVASELCVANDLLFRGSRLVMLPNLEQTYLQCFTLGTKESLNVDDVFCNQFGGQALLKTLKT